MHISNYYAGYGMTEFLENLVSPRLPPPSKSCFINHSDFQFGEFNKILSKRNVSHLKKWSYMEGLIIWLFVCDLYSLMSALSPSPHSILLPLTEKSERQQLLHLPNLQFLHHLHRQVPRSPIRHSLIAPDSAVPNANECTLIMLRFLQKDATEVGHRIRSIEKIVQAADKPGLVSDFRKEIGVKEEDVKALRERPAKNVDYKKEVSFQF